MVKKENKRGQVRIIESAMAVMLMLGFVIFIQSNAPGPDISGSVYRIQHQILVEIEKNESLRNAVVGNDVLGSTAYAKSRLQPYGLNFEMDVCPVNGGCLCSDCPAEKQIYGDSIIISGSLNKYDPKKLAMFMWS